MASIPTLHALLIDELKDLLHAERQLLKALPKMVKAATHRDLKAGFSEHLAQTRGHVSRLADSLQVLGLPATGKPCHAMIGLIEECEDVLEMKAPNAVRDAALIGAAQRIEHYEMAGYGTARAFAQTLGEKQINDLLHATLEEEGEANKKLTTISLSVNAEALATGGRIDAKPSTKKTTVS